ncbi:S-layer homology domain-containing protein [Paenibacillus amylolyticus]|uniref:S-layer homology domain-containing protein n=1 Tax=Paenibacillus amylolyticus TaxID=1451 RepID=UPI00201E5197|nr:S-layer homology domain-containing protein [Paenibacillus amylolyticus]MCL6663474.1 S-layer homology domain-containing protein [Paenibacillus amylolyticus]
MPKGKFSKVLSVVLSASMLAGSFSFLGGGEAEAANLDSAYTLSYSVGTPEINQIYKSSDTTVFGYKTGDRNLLSYNIVSKEVKTAVVLEASESIAALSDDGSVAVIRDTSLGSAKTKFSYYKIATQEKVVFVPSVDYSNITGMSISGNGNTISYADTKTQLYYFYDVTSGATKSITPVKAGGSGVSIGTSPPMGSVTKVSKDGSKVFLSGTTYGVYRTYIYDMATGTAKIFLYSEYVLRDIDDTHVLVSTKKGDNSGWNYSSVDFDLVRSPLTDDQLTTAKAKYVTLESSMYRPADDNQVFYALKDKGLVVVDASDVFNSMPDVKRPATVQNVTKSMVKEKLTLNWDSNITAKNGFEVTRDGQSVYKGMNKSYVDTFKEIGESHSYSVYALNEAGKSDPATVSVTLESTGTAKLGSLTVELGSRVLFNDQLWRVLGDNKIVADKDQFSTMPYDVSGSVDNAFSPTTQTNIGYKLNSLYLALPTDIKSMIKRSSYPIYLTDKSLLKNVNAYIALPNISDYEKLPFTLSNSWTMDKETSTATSRVYFGTVLGTYTSSANVTPVITLVDNVKTEYGDGSYDDPYFLNGLGAAPEEKLSAPANLKVNTEERLISASWDLVSGAQDYTMKVNGILVYKGTEPGFSYTNVVPDTTYLVQVFGNKNGDTPGEISSLTVKTKEALPKLPAPINFTTNVINKNSLVTSWNPVVGAETYTVIINGEVAYHGAESTSQVFHDMLPNTTYVVEVFASRNGVAGERAISSSTTPEAEIKFEAPGTPTVNNTEAGNVKISWNATSGALLYKVFRNGVEVGSVSSPSYTDKNAVEGEAYLYTVRAFDGVKTSESSPFVLVTVTEKVTVPKAPSNPMNFKVVSDEHSVTTTWDAATGATEYKLVINGIEVYRGPNLTYTYSNLPEKTEYRVEITAINAFGESGTQLFTIKTKDPKKLPAAKNPKAETTHNEASISWDAVDGATSYWVKINNNFVYEGTDTFFTATGLGDDRPYTVYIYAEAKSSTGKIEGEPATLFIVTKKIPVVLDKPANLVANPKATYVKLTWNAVAGATEYIVKQGQSIVYQGPLTVFTDVELESGTTYDYTVVASNGTAKSEEATVSATTLVNQLPYPANLRITNLEWNYIRLDWDAVEGADEYLITRNGMSIGVPMGTWWDEDLEDIMPGATYTYKVAAYKGGVLGKEAVKVVTIPTEPIEGQAPEGNLVIKANRVEHSRVGLSWTTVAGATYYDVYQDGENLVYHGSLNTITDPNVGPQEQHTYKVVAGNQWGTLDSNVIDITTPAAPQSIVIAPSKPVEGTITFNYKIVEGAVMYVERNPQTKATPVGDGTYHVTYFNSATGETRDEGIVTPINGMLQFSETGVDPGKNYHYDIMAVILKADGTEEVVAKEEVSVITPADGSGVTVPGTIVDPTNPGTGGTTPTTPPSPPVTGGGSTGGSSSGGTTTQPTVDGKDSVPGTVVVPGTDDGTVTVPTAPETNFSDISGNFAEEAIKNLTASGVLKGYADGTFGPNKKIIRAEFAIMAKRALGYTNSNAYVQEFKDFKQNAWYAEELLTALDSGITKGFTDGTYRPDVFIPREQAAVMIANVLEKNNLDKDVNEKIFMDDRDIIEWAKTSVYLLKTHKIVEGQNNLFYPKREITRAEAAVMIDRMLNLLNK